MVLVEAVTRAVVIVGLVLVLLVCGVGWVYGTRSEEFVLVCSLSALVYGWLLVSVAFSRFDR